MELMNRRAILVLECPWGLDSTDVNRSSVLPFVEGIAKYAGGMDVYHANFYDKSSFVKALNYLCGVKFENAIIYVAAHGYKKKIGGVDIGSLLFELGEKSKACNITGIMLGSCFVGENVAAIKVYLEGTHLKWCAGYSSESNWLAGTMIDCSIMSSMAALDVKDFESRERIVEAMALAISPFSRSFEIGRNYKFEPVALEGSIQFIVQSTGRGQRANLVTEEVFAEYENLQLFEVG
jgi:hypothetical protein